MSAGGGGNVPANIKGIPVVPVGIALLVGFSVGLAVSIAIDQKARKDNPAYPFVAAPNQPCADCAQRSSVPVTPAQTPPETPGPMPTVNKDANVPG